MTLFQNETKGQSGSLRVLFNLLCNIQLLYIRHATTTRGEGGRPSLPFFENQKNALIFEIKALIVSILRLNLPFKL